MDRQKSLEKLREYELNSLLRELMEIFEPGEKLKWGSKKHADLIAYAAIHLAVEFQALTGQPLMDMINEPLLQAVMTSPEVPAEEVLPL